ISAVVLGGPLQRVPDPSFPPRPLLRPWIRMLPLQLDSVPLPERLDGRGEIQPLLLLHEPKDVPARLAAEAVVELVAWFHLEGRRPLLVEGAVPPVVLPALLQVRVSRDDLDDVRRLLDAIDALPGEPAQLIGLLLGFACGHPRICLLTPASRS